MPELNWQNTKTPGKIYASKAGLEEAVLIVEGSVGRVGSWARGSWKEALHSCPTRRPPPLGPALMRRRSKQYEHPTLFISGNVARRIPLLQADNDLVEVFTPRILRGKLEYMHNNPVKKGLVTRPDEWMYSSCRAYEQGTQEPIRIDRLGAMAV